MKAEITFTKEELEKLQDEKACHLAINCERFFCCDCPLGYIKDIDEQIVFVERHLEKPAEENKAE